MNTNDSNPSKIPPTPTPSFSEGQKLAGCYGLKRQIAGAGEPGVWLAHDEVLGKDVSLHFVPTVLLRDSTAMGELRQEVKRTRQLIHPNILRAYDLVEDADWAAVSMDAFEGESLSERLGKMTGVPIDPETLLPWAMQLCQTLEDAHKINVAHRDVSPSNVFLSTDGKVLVASFGISRAIADAAARLSGTANARLGAASPQQIEGAAATRLDDIYAIGALLFQCLTGRLPFVGDDLPGQIRNEVPSPVSALRGKSAAPIPEGWEKAIAACLEKKPENRPQTAAEIANRLTAAGTGAAIAPASPAVVEKKEVEAGPEAPVVAKSAVAKAAKTEPKLARKMITEPAVASGKPAPAPSSGERKFVPDVYANLDSERSRFPTVGLAVAAGLMVIGAVGYYFNGMGKGTSGAESATELTSTDQPEGSELRSVNNKIEVPIPAVPPTTADIPAAEIPPALPAEAAAAKPVPAEPEILLAAAAKPAATPTPAGAPAPVPVQVSPTGPMTEEEKAVAEKAAALETVKKAAQAAEKAREEMTKQQQQAEAAVAEAQKTLEQKSKALSPVKKAVEEVMTQRRKLEDEQKAADLAAEQARQLAAEKTRLAEAAKKAIADLETKNKDKLAAQEKADAEMQTLQKALADKQQSAAGMAKAATEAEASRQQHLAAIKQSEQEVELAKVAAVEARRLREEAEAERRKLAQELADMQKMMEKKKAEIEDRLRKLENPTAKPPAPAPAPEPAKTPDAKPGAPMPVTKPTSASTPPASPVVPVAPTAVAVLPKSPAPVTPAAEPKPEPSTPAAPPVAPADPTQLVMKTEPPKVPSIPAPALTKPSVPAPGGSENSLGMRFVPMGDVDFSVWQTRVKDFDVFARAVNLKSTAWRGPGFKQAPDHPVVNVTWVEAVAFCKWLTDLEHKEGALPANQFYRLPTDLEWSKAVGLPEETGRTPEARDMGVSDVYPWGTQWPPPPNSGNYTGEETGSDVAIKGYDDGFAWTSPVGSFPPNKLGLYDMGGNVWQWCMDAWNSDSKAKVLRGASWYNGALKLSLLSSCRVHASPDSSTDNYGFRVVRATDAVRPGRK